MTNRSITLFFTIFIFHLGEGTQAQNSMTKGQTKNGF